jgi:hypothetical protein
MSTEVVNSYNIFIDTERDINATSDGDSIMLSLNQTPITCADNQFIRMTLQSFSMYKSFTNVNPNNNLFRITHAGNATTRTDYPLYLPALDYSSLNSLATTFATLIADQLAADIGGGITYTIPTAGATALTPPQSGDTDNIITFVVNFSAAHNLTKLLIRTLVEDGDSFEVLGTNRIRFDDGTPAWDLLNSMSIDYSTANSVTFSCLYNAQASSQQNVYLRTDATNTNIQTESFNSGNTDSVGANSMSASNILGRMTIDNEFVNFVTGTQMEYFITITSKQITHLRLYITDSHGRTIPQNIKYANNISVIANPSQLNLGNRSWEGVIKVDIVQYMGGQNNYLDSGGVAHSVPARFGTEPLNKFNYGASGFPDRDFSRMRM